MKYLVLSSILQGVRLEAGGMLERQLASGDTIEVNEKEAAELIACGAIAPEPIDEGLGADLSPVSGDGQGGSDQAASTDTALKPAPAAKKKAAADKAAS